MMVLGRDRIMCRICSEPAVAGLRLCAPCEETPVAALDHKLLELKDGAPRDDEPPEPVWLDLKLHEAEGVAHALREFRMISQRSFQRTIAKLRVVWAERVQVLTAGRDSVPSSLANGYQPSCVVADNLSPLVITSDLQTVALRRVVDLIAVLNSGTPGAGQPLCAWLARYHAFCRGYILGLNILEIDLVDQGRYMQLMNWADEAVLRRARFMPATVGGIAADRALIPARVI